MKSFPNDIIYILICLTYFLVVSVFVSSVLFLCVSTVQVPNRVESLQAEALSPTSIQVSWEPPSQPNGPILGYRLLWTESPSGKERVSTITAAVLPIRTLVLLWR